MILIVDDDPAIRKLIIRLLQKIGEFEYVEAEHGQDALMKCNDSVDLVITDIDMPIMSGDTLIKTLRTMSTKKEFRILVVSTHIYEGADATIQKPFSALEFQEKVRNLLGK
jgi:two-component system chemotaxis response regulator CheY